MRREWIQTRYLGKKGLEVRLNFITQAASWSSTPHGPSCNLSLISQFQPSVWLLTQEDSKSIPPGLGSEAWVEGGVFLVSVEHLGDFAVPRRFLLFQLLGITSCSLPALASPKSVSSHPLLWIFALEQQGGLRKALVSPQRWWEESAGEESSFSGDAVICW